MRKKTLAVSAVVLEIMLGCTIDISAGGGGSREQTHSGGHIHNSDILSCDANNGLGTKMHIRMPYVNARSALCTDQQTARSQSACAYHLRVPVMAVVAHGGRPRAPLLLICIRSSKSGREACVRPACLSSSTRRNSEQL